MSTPQAKSLWAKAFSRRDFSRREQWVSLVLAVALVALAVVMSFVSWLVLAVVVVVTALAYRFAR